MKGKKLKNYSNYFIILGIALSLSILFQVYWLGMQDGVMNEGGSVARFFMKLCALFFIYIGLYSVFSIKIFTYNLILKIPLIYYLLTVIAVIPYIIGNAYNQAINLLFFAPFLFIDFRGIRGREVFSFLVKIIVCVVCIQLVLDVVIKIMGLQLVSTLLGGMGNANTFGLYLIVSALAFKFLYHRYNISRLLLMSVFATGSLACSLIAIVFILQSFFVSFRLIFRPATIMFLLSATAVTYYFIDFFIDFIFEEFNPLWHAYMKLLGLINFVFLNETAGATSISLRAEYTTQGLLLLSENPMALIFGHPGFIPFYSGDGFVIALLVTLGLPITFLFFICNLIAVYRGFKENDPLSIFSAYVVLTFMALMVTNRILDYWPAGLIYMLTFSYLVRKRYIGLSRA